MIKIQFKVDFDFSVIKIFILKNLILKRAYKGYLKYVELYKNINHIHHIKPKSYQLFKEFEFYKIRFAFML